MKRLGVLRRPFHFGSLSLLQVEMIKGKLPILAMYRFLDAVECPLSSLLKMYHCTVLTQATLMNIQRIIT